MYYSTDGIFITRKSFWSALFDINNLVYLLNTYYRNWNIFCEMLGILITHASADFAELHIFNRLYSSHFIATKHIGKRSLRESLKLQMYRQISWHCQAVKFTSHHKVITWWHFHVKPPSLHRVLLVMYEQEMNKTFTIQQLTMTRDNF